MSWRRELVATASAEVPVHRVMGKQRPRTDYRTRRTYTPTETVRAEAEIRAAWLAENGDGYRRHVGPVRMRITTQRPLAKSNPKFWEGRADIGKPDWDNVGKLVCDALNGVAFADDQQVTACTVEKGPRPAHGEQPRIGIRIEYYEERYEK